MKGAKEFIFVIFVIVILVSVSILSGSEKKQDVIKAIPAGGALTVDGILNEKVWQAKGTGVPGAEKTTVWVAFDKKALYIGARLLDSEPGKIAGGLVSRDEYTDSDWFVFSVDTQYNGRGRYEFGVNPSGSVVDYAVGKDNEKNPGWNGVWESKTRIGADGWTVEMKIPFEQLSIKRKEKQVWGVNFRRTIKRTNEKVSYSAALEGLEGVKPRRTVELMPYAAGKAQFSPGEEEFSANAGLDLKTALKPGLNLHLTVNPDFVDAEPDAAAIDLSTYEVYYEEKRPFFAADSDIFTFGRGGIARTMDISWKPPHFFYSHRIGRTPQRAVSSLPYGDSPGLDTTILAAAKITGKTAGGWDVGFISALTEREYGRVYGQNLTGETNSSEEIEPFTFYGVLRARKEFNEGRQGLGFISTAVLRNLRSQEMQDILNRDAFAFAVDGWSFLGKKKKWAVSGWLGGTRVSGSKNAITLLQNSIPHLYQRPDMTHVSVDENATAMTGWAGRFNINKERGNFLFNASVCAVSPGFDVNDIGFLWYTDRICTHVMVGYRHLKPSKLLNYWDLQLISQKNFDFAGNKIWEQGVIIQGNAVFKNNWGLYGRVAFNPDAWHADDSRGGPLVVYNSNRWGELMLYSDGEKPFSFNLVYAFLDVDDSSNYKVIASSLQWRVNRDLYISLSNTYADLFLVDQWVANVQDVTNTATYGNRYVFAETGTKTVSCELRFFWRISPKLSLRGYFQPFIAAVAYERFKELALPRSFDFNTYGQGNSRISYGSGMYTVDPDGSAGIAAPFSFANPDFNWKSLRGSLVLGWKYRPGSSIKFIWAQRRSDFSNPGSFKFGRDFGDALSAEGDHIFMLKFTHNFKL